MSKFNKFIPLSKMEEQSDGTLHVFGIVTAEVPDLELEVCDYEGTKPYYKAQAAKIFKATSAVDGMTPSIMPLREMHQLKAIGAGRSIEFDDEKKAIKMGFHVVDSEAVKKFKAGVLIGFSQGGSYVGEMVPDPTYPNCKRYVADPGEVSGVDSPCLPIALIETMKGRSVPMMKANGSVSEVPLVIPTASEARISKLESTLETIAELLKEKKTKRVDGVDLTASCFAHVGDPNDPETWKLPIKFPGDDEKTKSHIRNALARFEQTEGMSAEEKKKARAKIVAAAKEHGIDVTEADKAAIAGACAKLHLEKGLYEVGWLGDMVEQLHWLCLQTEFEREMEDDGSKVPEALRTAWMALIEQFKAMAIEEADELAAAGGKKEKGMKITDQAGLTKAAKTIHEHLEKHHEMHKAHHEKLEALLHKDHPIVKHSAAMMEHCEKCMKAAKDAGMGEEPEEDKTEKGESEAEKATSAKIDALTKAVADLTEKLSKTAAGNIPASGARMDKAEAATEFDSLLAK